MLDAQVPARPFPCLAPPFEQDFENEWYEQAYHEGVEDYEKSCLREFFVQEMKRVCPEWMDVFKVSKVKADFEFAVGIVEDKGYGEIIDEWITVVEEGDVPFNLREELGQC
jgi:hypothetical protein